MSKEERIRKEKEEIASNQLNLILDDIDLLADRKCISYGDRQLVYQLKRLALFLQNSNEHEAVKEVAKVLAETLKEIYFNRLKC